MVLQNPARFCKQKKFHRLHIKHKKRRKNAAIVNSKLQKLRLKSC